MSTVEDHPSTPDDHDALEEAIDPDGDLEEFITRAIAERVSDAGFRRRGPVTDAQVHAAFDALLLWEESSSITVGAMRAALEAAEAAR